MADKLKDALDKWSWSGGAANWNKVIEGTYGNILGFTRGQEVVDQMREYNKQLGNVLTDDQLIDGLNKFSQQQFDQYGSGYAVDSDPFNIARWAVATALQGVGANEAANNLIASTDARQKLTSQQAIDIGKKAQDEYAAADTQMRELAKVTGYGGGTTLGDFHMEDSFGDFVLSAAPLLMAGAVGGAFSPGGLFGGAGATAGAAGLDAAALATGDAMAGLIPAGELGAWTGAAGAAGATGGSNMGIFDDLLSQFTDVPVGQPSGWDFGPNLSDFTSPSGWDFGPGNIVDGGWNFGPGNIADIGIDTVSGMTLENLNPGILDTVTNWMKSNPGSTVQNAIKALTGSAAGAAGAGGGNSLLGAGLGGLLGLLNGSKQAGTTTTTTEPWAGQQPYLLDAFKKAQAASGGSPIQTQANANYQSVLSGPTTNPMLGMDNPYLTKAIDNANSDVNRAMMPAMNQANRASGSFGNSGVADTYGKSLTDAYSRNATGMRMQDYTNQQQLQQQAVQNNLGLTTGANTFAAQPSQNYAQTVQGNYGQTQTSPYFTNPFAGFAGGAAIGSKIGANLGF